MKTIIEIDFPDEINNTEKIKEIQDAINSGCLTRDAILQCNYIADSYDFVCRKFHHIVNMAAMEARPVFK